MYTNLLIFFYTSLFSGGDANLAGQAPLPAPRAAFVPPPAALAQLGGSVQLRQQLGTTRQRIQTSLPVTTARTPLQRPQVKLISYTVAPT